MHDSYGELNFKSPILHPTTPFYPNRCMYDKQERNQSNFLRVREHEFGLISITITVIHEMMT